MKIKTILPYLKPNKITTRWIIREVIYNPNSPEGIINDIIRLFGSKLPNTPNDVWRLVYQQLYTQIDIMRCEMFLEEEVLDLDGFVDYDFKGTNKGLDFLIMLKKKDYENAKKVVQEEGEIYTLNKIPYGLLTYECIEVFGEDYFHNAFEKDDSLELEHLDNYLKIGRVYPVFIDNYIKIKSVFNKMIKHGATAYKKVRLSDESLLEELKLIVSEIPYKRAVRDILILPSRQKSARK